VLVWTQKKDIVLLKKQKKNFTKPLLELTCVYRLWYGRRNRNRSKSPVIAKIAREEGILTIGVVTKPFFFEGRERMRIAEEGLAELEKEVDAMIVIPNDRILASVDQKTS
jgi:hypothetical protein